MFVPARKTMLGLCLAAGLVFAVTPAQAQPPNNDFVNAVILSGSGTIGGTTVDADGETGEPSQPDQGQFNSVWYRFTPSASGPAHFDTCTDVLYDGYMASYTGPAVDQLTNIGFSDDGCGGFGTGSVLDFDVTAGTTYSVAIDGWQTEVGNFTLTYSIPQSPQAAPTVTINQASGQVEPTSASPIHFTTVFNQTVTGFATGDVTIGGTAGATTGTVTEIAPNDGTTYDVAVSGMTQDGTVSASIPAGVAFNASNQGNRGLHQRRQPGDVRTADRGHALLRRCGQDGQGRPRPLAHGHRGRVARLPGLPLARALLAAHHPLADRRQGIGRRSLVPLSRPDSEAGGRVPLPDQGVEPRRHDGLVRAGAGDLARPDFSGVAGAAAAECRGAPGLMLSSASTIP